MIRLPKQFNANFISRHFFPQYFPNQLEEINGGQCYEWAYIAYRLFSGVKLMSTHNHAWVKVNTLHYDSESPNGVNNCMRLKTNKAFSYDIGERYSPNKIGERYSPNKFKKYWRNDHKFWDRGEKYIEKILGTHYTKSTPIIKF